MADDMRLVLYVPRRYGEEELNAVRKTFADTGWNLIVDATPVDESFVLVFTRDADEFIDLRRHLPDVFRSADDAEFMAGRWTLAGSSSETIYS